MSQGSRAGLYTLVVEVDPRSLSGKRPSSDELPRPQRSPWRGVLQFKLEELGHGIVTLNLHHLRILSNPCTELSRKAKKPKPPPCRFPGGEPCTCKGIGALLDAKFLDSLFRRFFFSPRLPSLWNPRRYAVYPEPRVMSAKRG